MYQRLLTETMLVTMENTDPLLSLSQIRQIRAESGPGRIWDLHTDIFVMMRLSFSVLGILRRRVVSCDLP